MVLQELFIQSFGGMRERSFRFAEGVNVLEGPNESGKSTLAAFIKYIFYGPGQKGSADRTRYLTGTKSGGWLTFVSDEGVLWRIERVTVVDSDGTKESVRDNVRILDTRTNRILPEKNPGEYFFGVNESVFVNTAFVGQMGTIRPDGTSLSGAVENMLQSADENVDLKRAADRLNQARRELMPKNSPGGKIREKEEEKAGLEEALAAASERAEKRLEAEAALRTAAAKRQEMEERKDELEALAEAAEVISSCKKLAAAEDTASKLKSYHSALEVLSAPPFSDLKEKLDDLEADGETAEEPVRQTSQLQMRNEDAAAALEEGEYLESKARLFMAVAIIMAIAGLASLAAGAIMVYFGFPTEQFVIPFAAMGVFVIVGIVFYVLQGKNLSRLDDILDDWGVDTLDELDEIAESGEGMSQPAANPAPKKKDSALTDPDRITRLNALAAACGVEVSDTPGATLAALRKKAEKAEHDRETVRAKVENLTGRLGALQEAVEGLDRAALVAKYKNLITTPVGKAAMQLDAEGLARVLKERDFTAGTWRAQSKKESELEQALAAMGTDEGRTPDVLSGMLSTVTEELEELKKQHAGYTLALEALKTAGETVRTTVIPTVTARASAVMEQATGGKYSRIAMDSAFGLQFTAEDGTDSVEMLSKGTADLAYVSLRLALSRTFFGENGREIPPMILDETFAAVDCGRLEKAMEAMCASGVQCLLFTCRGEEARIGEKLGCAVTSMQG